MNGTSQLERGNEAAAIAQHFVLPAAITIETVEGLAINLKQLPAAMPLTLDAAQTEIITTPGIQLLLALAKTLESHGITLTLTQPKPAFAQAFEQLGLGARFTQWETAHD